MALELRGVGVRFGERWALHGVSLTIPEGSVVSLLGPSGSGKTTLLRVIAGLEPPIEGAVLLDGKDLARVPAHQRGIGLMFQDFALFPHRDAFGNVAFGLRMQGVARDAQGARVKEVLELVGLPGFEHRAIAALSGGEQQRVALARALAPRPRVLLLDEPMGSLDRSLRERLPTELRELFARLTITVLYVTHDQEEALAVADRTIVLRDGRVEADGSAVELWTAPPSGFVARFLGHRNVGAGTLMGGRVQSPWGELAVPAGGAAARLPDGPVTVVLRPGAVEITPDGPIPGAVTGRRFRGDHFVLDVQPVGAAAALELEARDSPIPEVGAGVQLSIDSEQVLLLPPEGNN